MSDGFGQSESFCTQRGYVMRIFLSYLALAWLGIGGWLLLEPAALDAYAGVAATSVDGTIELRAMYGGMELAVGLSALWALWRPRWACHVLLPVLLPVVLVLVAYSVQWWQVVLRSTPCLRCHLS